GSKLISPMNMTRWSLARIASCTSVASKKTLKHDSAYCDRREWAGTSDGSSGTSDGSAGTSDGSAGTSDGSAGTSDGSAGTSDGWRLAAAIGGLLDEVPGQMPGEEGQ